MKILVTGATGLIGQQLCSQSILHGHQLIIVTRQSENQFRQDFTYPCEYLHWSHLKTLNHIDAIIHLAGDSIASGRWTSKKKQSILSSRTETSKSLIEALELNHIHPEVFISTSAIGYYGDDKDILLEENHPPGTDFLSDVCQKWENSVRVIEQNTRLVIFRVGVVLDSKGGFLKRLKPIFSSYLGGRVGSGQQWMSWIHIQDLIRMYIFALENKEIRGTFNAVSPLPVTNNEFTKIFAKQLKVPSLLPIPALALRIGLGEMAQLALQSQRVSANKICSQGFQFKFSEISTALNDLYS